MKTTTVCPRCGVEFTRKHVVDHPPIYCSVRCTRTGRSRLSEAGREKLRQRMRGPAHPNFKGEWTVTKDGQTRVRVWIDEAMQARLGVPGTRKRHALRSRVNWLLAHPDETLGRHEPVHHVNGDTMDDRPANLMKLPSNRDHILLHPEQVAAINARRGRMPDTPCEVCGAPKRPWRRFCSFACRGTAFRGPGNPNYRSATQTSAKLTAAQVAEIRRRYRPRVVTAAMLASEYGVAPSTIAKVVRRVAWAHVP